MKNKFRLLVSILVIIGLTSLTVGLYLLSNLKDGNNKQHDDIVMVNTISGQKMCTDSNVCFSDLVIGNYINNFYYIEGIIKNEGISDIKDVYVTLWFKCKSRDIMKLYHINVLKAGGVAEFGLDFHKDGEITTANAFEVRMATEEEIAQGKLEDNTEE